MREFWRGCDRRRRDRWNFHDWRDCHIIFRAQIELIRRIALTPRLALFVAAREVRNFVEWLNAFVNLHCLHLLQIRIAVKVRWVAWGWCSERLIKNIHALADFFAQDFGKISRAAQSNSRG